MKRRLLRDQRGGTDFVQALIMIALIAFFALVSVNLFGDAVADKFSEEADDVLALNAGAAHSGEIPIESSPPVHTPGTTTPGSAPTSESSVPSGDPWPSWMTPVIRWAPAGLGPFAMYNYYSTDISFGVSAGGTGGGYSGAIGVNISDPDAPVSTQVGIDVTEPGTWLVGAAAADAVLSGETDNTQVQLSAPVPTGLAKKILRKVLSEGAVAKLVKAFPELEGHLVVAIQEGIRSAEIGGQGNMGPDAFKVGVSAHVFGAEDGSFGVNASIGVTEAGHAQQGFGITVTMKPRDVPLHEEWLRDWLGGGD